ncbi:DUF4396 domain-containing protein [Noviherbaspirillum sp. DKR-6]|uniref:DUF4396 domain-containing protein n=1 Tax=Noviherbaspirillum pedocola TaxID=2801341 RepID=A0A934W6S8_9BURK|nr:DUF4396 domain-containing protein [Noviherbaspirillum pedocola]
MNVTPHWLHVLSLLFLALGFGCALFIAVDVLRHPQKMWIMDVVWPVTALFGTVASLWLYWRYGRLSAKDVESDAKERGEQPPAKQLPFPVMVAKGASHCGSGCCIGDIIAEWLAFAVPAVATWFGWHSLFSEKIFAVWVLDFVLAFLIGVAFQYFTIAPMRHLGFLQGVWAAVKADTLSLTAWQVGMYGFMAIAYFWIFGTLLHTKLEVASPEFWFMMQIAMLCGFATSYPVNWWLLKAGLKEKM